AFVQGGDNVLIGGFIVGGNSLLNNLVVIRALGLPFPGTASPIHCRTQSLNCTTRVAPLFAANDDWQDHQKAQIMASGLAPANAKESVIFTRLPAGQYTAIVGSADDTTGIGLLEVYSPL
ncbi:MAG: hypothetical protein H0X34_11520, partial [Chthoniobacterales bacterium]|nr:hypothetical protein [Chthoniobacterales bacterium]